MLNRREALLIGAGLLAAGCTPADSQAPSAASSGTAGSVATSPAAASPSATAATVTPTRTPSSTLTPTPSATPEAYPGLSIASLRTETWGAAGEISTVADLGEQGGFHRYRISYPSDGFAIDGFCNVPSGPGPFPVVLLCHGYMPTDSYELLSYTTQHADALARAGFLVLHPSYRNHRGSATGAPNEFRIGYARDVMHLTTLARRLPQADGKRVQLWGHSMGGGIDLRALAVRGQEYASAVLYGSMSADEAANYRQMLVWRQQRGSTSATAMPAAPEADPALYAAVSPMEYLHDLRVPVQLHHGELDEQVPLAWSRDLDERFTAWGVPHEYHEYPGGPHNLAGAQLELLLQRCIAWFRQYADR